MFVQFVNIINPFSISFDERMHTLAVERTSFWQEELHGWVRGNDLLTSTLAGELNRHIANILLNSVSCELFILEIYSTKLGLDEKAVSYE